MPKSGFPMLYSIIARRKQHFLCFGGHVLIYFVEWIISFFSPITRFNALIEVMCDYLYIDCLLFPFCMFMMLPVTFLSLPPMFWRLLVFGFYDGVGWRYIQPDRDGKLGMSVLKSIASLQRFLYGGRRCLGLRQSTISNSCVTRDGWMVDL